MKETSLKSEDSNSFTHWSSQWECDGLDAISHPFPRKRCNWTKKMKNSSRREGIFWKDSWRSWLNSIISCSQKNSKYFPEELAILKSSWTLYRCRPLWQCLKSTGLISKLMKINLKTKSMNSSLRYRRPKNFWRRWCPFSKSRRNS